METKVQKWGNSLAVRLPKDAAENAGLRQGSAVLIIQGVDLITIKPVSKPKETLAQMVRKITYRETSDANEAEVFKPKYAIENGKTYTVSDLIKYMIVYSDNNAANSLAAHVDSNSLSEVYFDLGIPVSPDLSEETMTPKIYSYIFRILYNATYLSKPMSQYALSLLSAVDFSNGIKAGIPADMPSARKFGERTVLNKNIATADPNLISRELHDCGIVYYPQNPYILCIMAKGSDFAKLSKIISDISSIAYQETASGVLKI